MKPSRSRPANPNCGACVRDWFAELLHQHRRDAEFSRRVFARWNHAGVYAPWHRLTLALHAAAAHPIDEPLVRELATAWADLGNQAPEGWEPTEDQPPPMGFVADPGSTLWDPFIADRALAAFGRLHQAAPQDPALRGEMARLTESLRDYPGAAGLREASAAAWDAHAACQADEEARMQSLDQAADARLELRGLGRVAGLSRRAGSPNMLVGGPDVDTLFVEPLLPVAQLTALHAARLAHVHTAGAPEGRPRATDTRSPPATLDEIVAMQERGRQAKTRFRREQGLTRPETLGMPSDFPEPFAPLLQAAVERGIRALRAAR